VVAKCERGAKGVSSLYRELLAKLYGVTIDAPCSPCSTRSPVVVLAWLFLSVHSG
jgi:hypothetical protein